MERDARNYAAMKEQGWKVIIIWECEVKEILRSRVIPRFPLRVADSYPTNEDLPESAALMAAEDL